MIQHSWFSPAVGPLATGVDNASPLLKTGAQTTVENLESLRTCRLTTTKVRYWLGSPPADVGDIRSPRIMRFLEVLFARCLVVQDVGSFGVETLAVDASEISRMNGGASPVAKVSAKHALNERGTRALGAGEPINFREQIL
jgi:hypothetical protein